MKVNEDQVTVTYIDRDKEPIVKKTDISCYTNILGIMDEYDFASWSHLCDKKAETDGFNTLEIKYNSGKTYFFLQSQELPEKALVAFSDVNSCLSEYAGICK